MWWVSPNYKLNDLKAVETTTTKNTTGDMLRCNGLKCCKVPLFKRAYLQVQLKFVSEHLNSLEKTWEKVLWGRNVESDAKITNNLLPQPVICVTDESSSVNKQL